MIFTIFVIIPSFYVILIMSCRTRNTYDRPDYTKSIWFEMLHKGLCKVPTNREHQIFRRRFGVTYARFKSIYDAALDWKVVEVIYYFDDIHIYIIYYVNIVGGTEDI
jgi:hypothetical protein